METLDEILKQLEPYATITLYQHDDETWSAKATLRIRAKGANFEIVSGFRHPTAKKAIIALRGNVFATVNDVNNLPKLGQSV